MTHLPEELSSLDINLYFSQKSVIVQFANSELATSQIGVYGISGTASTEI